MATGKTVSKFVRHYVDGRDLSGSARSIGPLTWEYDEADFTTMLDGAKTAFPGQATIGPGTLNGIFDNGAAAAFHTVFSAYSGGPGVTMTPIGIRAAPAAGDPVFLGPFHLSYPAELSGPAVYANIAYGQASQLAPHLAYTKPWGVLLHAQAARTGANTAVGIDDLGVSSAFGGYLCYQIFSAVGSGSVTIKVQDAATNLDASFADLTGATSGAIAHTALPCAGIVAIGTTATVRRYLRWQIALVGITSVTFALAFVRSTQPGV